MRCRSTAGPNRRPSSTSSVKDQHLGIQRPRDTKDNWEGRLQGWPVLGEQLWPVVKVTTSGGVCLLSIVLSDFGQATRGGWWRIRSSMACKQSIKIGLTLFCWKWARSFIFGVLVVSIGRRLTRSVYNFMLSLRPQRSNLSEFLLKSVDYYMDSLFTRKQWYLLCFTCVLLRSAALTDSLIIIKHEVLIASSSCEYLCLIIENVCVLLC